MGRTFQEKREIPRFFPWLKEQLKDTPAFFRDTKLNFNIREYYFYRDKFDDSINEALALGGALSYQSGWFLDHFGVGAVLYTSQRLYGWQDRDGTLLLKPEQQSYTQVGQIYARVKLFEDNFINLYRYEYNTPYINKNDNRIPPIPSRDTLLRVPMEEKMGLQIQVRRRLHHEDQGAQLGSLRLDVRRCRGGGKSGRFPLRW